MSEIDLSTINVSSTNLDHHGIVAATFKDLGLIEKINTRIENKDPRRIVSTGHAVLAMVMNGLGFTNRRLYLSPQFFESKPVDKLIDPSITAKNLDDHALGEALDEIYEYGVSRFFGEIALEVGIEQNLFGKNAHLDSTSFSVEGEYEHEPDIHVIKVTEGFSKDHRPDLKQVMLALCTSGPSDFPFWIEPQSGNASDKAEFDKIIKKVQAFKKELKNSPLFRWVADSALYSKKELLKSNDYLWISRVPETITEAKEALRKEDSLLSWMELGNGYKASALSSCYGDIEQRWLLVYSEQAYKREKITFEKNLKKKSDELDKALWHLKNRVFGCESDIEVETKKLRKKYPLHDIEFTVESIEKNSTRGRPTKKTEKIIKGYQCKTSYKTNKKLCEERLNQKGRFILATNDLNKESLSDGQILEEYKAQQSVERGFRFLKDPWFMVDSIFLKSPRRIEALMSVMTLCLMVYNVAQHRLRESLKESSETIPNQKNKPISNPTLRWVFQIMEGITRVILDINGVIKVQTANLTDLRRQIIRHFGATAMDIYGFL